MVDGDHVRKNEANDDESESGEEVKSPISKTWSRSLSVNVGKAEENFVDKLLFLCGDEYARQVSNPASRAGFVQASVEAVGHVHIRKFRRHPIQLGFSSEHRLRRARHVRHPDLERVWKRLILLGEGDGESMMWNDS